MPEMGIELPDIETQDGLRQIDAKNQQLDQELEQVWCRPPSMGAGVEWDGCRWSETGGWKRNETCGRRVAGDSGGCAGE